MAQAAAVTSHLGELALRSLSTRACQLSGLPVTWAQLDEAADFMVGMRAAWQQVERFRSTLRVVAGLGIVDSYEQVDRHPEEFR